MTSRVICRHGRRIRPSSARREDVTSLCGGENILGTETPVAVRLCPMQTPSPGALLSDERNRTADTCGHGETCTTCVSVLLPAGWYR
jgi:hypothetical protein